MFVPIQFAFFWEKNAKMIQLSQQRKTILFGATAGTNTSTRFVATSQMSTEEVTDKLLSMVLEAQK